MDLEKLRQEAWDSLHVLAIEASHDRYQMNLIKDIDAYLTALEAQLATQLPETKEERPYEQPRR